MYVYIYMRMGDTWALGRRMAKQTSRIPTNLIRATNLPTNGGSNGTNMENCVKTGFLQWLVWIAVEQN